MEYADVRPDASDSSENISPLMTGRVEQVRFQAPTGYAVLSVRRSPHEGPATTVVGTAPPAQEGMEARIWGEVSTHRVYGAQIVASRIELKWPTTGDGMRRCLEEGLLPSLGPTLGARVYEAFGDEFAAVVSKDPKRLCSVPGVGPKRMRQIVEAWRTSQDMYEVLAWLGQLGLGSLHSMRVWNLYGAQTRSRVEDDPYRLCFEVDGLGFSAVDALAQHLGIDGDAPQRIAAALHYILEREAQIKGHCAVPKQQVASQAAHLLSIAEETVFQALSDMGRTRDPKRKLVLDEVDGQGWVQLPSLFWAEAEVAQAIGGRIGKTPPWNIEALQCCLNRILRKSNVSLSVEQQDAARLMLGNAIALLVGGPGVGKTMILQFIVEALVAENVKVALCAPTGRAAQRMGELAGREASTLHRLLGFTPGQGFTVTAEDPLDVDVVLVDESSMLEIRLVRALVEALSSRAALWFIGDPDQLPPVGPGDFLRDMLEVHRAPVARLTRVYRQAAQSAIVSNAHRINAGRMPTPPIAGQEPDFWVVSPSSDDLQNIQKEIVDLVDRRLPSFTGVDARIGIQVLTGIHKGPLGVQSLNDVLQEALNPGLGEDGFRVGDKIMQTRNDHDRGVMNGDLGYVVEVVEKGCRVKWANGQTELHEGVAVHDLQLAYAITVHKSQGSEFKVAVIVLHPSHGVFVDRSLLYTAVTRARSCAVIVGQPQWIKKIIDRKQSRQRWTRLKMRLLAQ